MKLEEDQSQREDSEVEGKGSKDGSKGEDSEDEDKDADQPGEEKKDDTPPAKSAQDSSSPESTSDSTSSSSSSSSSEDEVEEAAKTAKRKAEMNAAGCNSESETTVKKQKTKGHDDEKKPQEKKIRTHVSDLMPQWRQFLKKRSSQRILKKLWRRSISNKLSFHPRYIDKGRKDLKLPKVLWLYRLDRSNLFSDLST